VNLELLKVEVNSTIKEALYKIDNNHLGIIIIVNAENKVVGIATDGDIRRSLLEGITIDDNIIECCNTNFVSALDNTPKENLIKILDHKIKVLPLLNFTGELIDVFHGNNLPVYKEEKVYARAKSPVRISFGGGGSDLTHYFINNGGAVINSTISLYSHASLIKRDDNKIIIDSRDLKEILEGEDLKDILSNKGNFGLIQAVLKVVNPEFGFELYLNSDFPMKSGLGGSAVVVSAILGCFNEFRIDKWNLYEIAEIAYQAERLVLCISGGWQDQYATVFGGINFMEFQAENNLIHPLRIDQQTILELEESIVLCDTKTIHESGDIHTDQKRQMSKTDVQHLVKKNVELTYLLRKCLLKNDLSRFGKLLDEAWQFKRQFSDKISTSHLDNIYEQAIETGALGGKLLGAGGGGFFIFYVPSNKKNILISKLESMGNMVRPFRFENDGLKSWSVREMKN